MDNFYDRVASSFSKLKKKPKSYSKLNEQLAEDIKKCMKDIYDFSNTVHTVDPNSNVLPELIIEGFDAEQIWQEVELKNVQLLDQSMVKINRLLSQKDNLVPKTSDPVPLPQQLAGTNEDDPSDDLSKNGVNDEGEHSGGDENDSEGDEIDKSGHLQDDEHDDEDINMSDEEGDEDDDESDTENVGEYIFGPETIPSDKFFEEDTAYSDAEGVEELPENEDVDSDAEDLREMEENAVKEKPWQMKGEVTSKDRPEYSLLEHTLEIDLSRKPAPVITEGTTLKLEELIKQRIKDKAFDSVERKAKPVETPLEYKKKLVLDQEKSKLSLAQIYENQYLSQEQSADPDHEKQEEEPELHKEIKSMMTKLFSKFDALSNYHFTPKPSAPELKVVSNLPAVLLEETVPLTTSDATLLAPEEIRGKAKGDLLGKSERTSSDKKRERRKKKRKQKLHALEHQKSKGTQLSGANIMKIKENPKAKKLKKGTVQVEESSKAIRSSTAFFDKLEDEIKTHKQDRTKNKRKSDVKFDAKRLKL